LTLGGKREELNVDFVLSIESFEAKKYNWKTKDIHVKIGINKGKGRLDPFPTHKEYDRGSWRK